MVSRKAKMKMRGPGRMAPEKFLADRGYPRKSKIILLLGLDFTGLHQ